MGDIFVPNELPDIIERYFTVDDILRKQNLTSDQKLGYLQGVSEVINFLRNCIEERSIN